MYEHVKIKKEMKRTTTPTKAKIEAKARELYVEHCYKSGCPKHAETNPELYELVESGFCSQAVSELMQNKTRAMLENDYIDFPQAFGVDIKEIFEANGLILGSRHTGKSDVAMKICDETVKEKAIVICFDPSTDWIKRSSITQYVKVKSHTVLDVPNESVIYDISLLSPIQQQRTVERFSKRLFETQAKTLDRKQFLIIFEEAHTYFFQGSMKAKAMQNTVRLLSVGRNVDIACILISQFAAMLDKFAVKHATSQMWFGYTKEPNDIKCLKQILGEDAEALAKLEDGEFIYVTRDKASKIGIEPYVNTSVKIQIVAEKRKSSDLKLDKKKQRQGKSSIASIIIAAMWLLAIIIAVNSR